MSNVEVVNPSDDSGYSWARAFRDIGIQAINTGQFPFFCMFIIAILFLFRLPPETLSTISLEVVNNFRTYVLSGYSLFGITLICVSLYVKVLKKRHKEQLVKQNALIEKLKEDLKISTTSTGGVL
ncbi:hypothetical protein [Acinetobacter pecorum]|uniref:Uncharacterized protein n=1 Tax=Acinetobacter pecorum TaxID=2762215 RepID=A0ABR8VVG1_9GAMM|nr:hypothetical protein [Acinetobacter pecorum]MBD8008760.1 hypothetical protein [Acinetobacter pecorum]